MLRKLKLNKFRINNIEYRCTGDSHQILKYTLNPYYGKESEYVYDENSKTYSKPGVVNTKYSPGLFKDKETAYTIASFEEYDDDCYELCYCSSRPFELSDEEFEVFRQLTKLVSDNLNNRDENKENY